MDNLPLDELVGLLVFIIAALAQLWATLRERMKKHPTRDPATVPQHEEQIPDYNPTPQEAAKKEKDTEELLRDFMDALGAPPTQVPHAPLPEAVPPPVILQVPVLPETAKTPHQAYSRPAIMAAPMPPNQLGSPSIKPPTFSWKIAPKKSASTCTTSSSNLAELLRDKTRLRQAVLLSEILGPPKALQK